MNEKKQLECQLDCKASASLQESILTDLEKEDGNIEELLNDKQTIKNTDETSN